MISRREQAMQNMVDMFATMQTGLPVEDPYTVQFDIVQRNPLDESAWKKRLSIGIHDTNETVAQRSSISDRTLKVVLEFRRILDTNETASTAGSEIFWNIQRRIWENKTLNGIAIEVSEIQNELYIDDFDKRQLSGAVFLNVMYRTASADPRRHQ